MKIVILTGMFQIDHVNGTEVATYNIAKTLAKKGHDVHIIASGNRKFPREGREDNFYVHRVFYPRIPSLGVLYFWLKIPFYIKKIDPDIVHCQATQIGFPALLYKIFFKTPYIVWGRGSDIYFNWKFSQLMNKLVLDSADEVIALTEDMKKKTQEFYKKDIFVIPNGVNLENLIGLSKETARGRLKIGINEKIIIFVGRLSIEKGAMYLIKAMGIIKEKNPELRLLLVGYGSEEKKLMKLVKDMGLRHNVDFIGMKKNKEVFEYMAASDVFVLPSLYEGFPNALLEAMASGLPIVASKVRGIPEIIEESENGFLVEPKDSNGIAEKILYLFDNSELKKRICLNNKEKVKNYSWDFVADSLIKVYSKCLNKK